ncbi:MAG: PrsW family glutamic-type intramembrane protease, partial [Candidatus Thalassarchaeaceae archaeon]
FTVGLGFALIENFQYIGISLMGGPLGITITILIRGIGSIPGHAVWTAVTGTALGWVVKETDFKTKLEWYANS